MDSEHFARLDVQILTWVYPEGGESGFLRNVYISLHAVTSQKTMT